MNHLDFLDTAAKLISTGNVTEADIRSAISRSYYAVYHHVLLWWKGNSRFPDYKDRGHIKMQMALFNAGISAVRDFSRDLKYLGSERRRTDYELILRFNLEDGQNILNLARRAIPTFNAINKVELREGIEGYLRKINQF